MTPSIEKAIQRSISKLSQENLDLDADEKKSSPNDHSYCVSKSPILFEDDDGMKIIKLLCVIFWFCVIN